LPASKWEWFATQLAERSMVAFDPRTGLPDRWSLDPMDTLGLIFWTRNGEHLVRNASLLRAYRTVVHFTLTGWKEVERRTPDLTQGIDGLGRLVDTFGPGNVTWRFSPVPAVSDVLRRFEVVAAAASRMGLQRVYVAFLQSNDWQPEPRSRQERQALLASMAAATELAVVLCNDDVELVPSPDAGWSKGVCEDGQRFGIGPRAEACGCALAVDPFTQNEACRYGCLYCYAGNKGTASKKRNTTRLPVVRGPGL